MYNKTHKNKFFDMLKTKKGLNQKTLYGSEIQPIKKMDDFQNHFQKNKD